MIFGEGYLMIKYSTRVLPRGWTQFDDHKSMCERQQTTNVGCHSDRVTMIELCDLENHILDQSTDEQHMTIGWI